jgi:hypothetical protein
MAGVSVGGFMVVGGRSWFMAQGTLGSLDALVGGTRFMAGSGWFRLAYIHLKD